MKRFFQFFVVAFISANIALAAAAMPQWIGNRIVDKIMDWGDRNVGGPFTKGGGDEAATRTVVSAVVMPGKAWKTAFDLTFKNETKTASVEQDTPGYSQKHGVPMPAGAQTQIPIGQPQAPTSQPTIIVNPEIHLGTHDGRVGSQRDTTTGKSEAPSAPATSSPAGNNTSGNSDTAASGQSDGAATASGAHPKPVMLEAGKTTLVQANKEVTFNPNPELATSTAQPTPTPVAKPSSTPSPAPTAAPAPSAAGGKQGGGGFFGMFSGAVGPAMPKDVGITPVQHDHDSSGHGGGGHADGPPGNHAGPDAHGAEVDHAGHIT